MGEDGRLNEPLRYAVLRILHALARVLLRHGVPLAAFVELAKSAYVDVAFRNFAIPGRKMTVSRAALLTGLTRKEVQRLVDSPEAMDSGFSSPNNRAARVVAGWVRDAEFHGADGQPKLLAVDNGPASFTALVRRYSGDVPPRAVLDELIRVGTAEREEDGRIRLLSRAYVPRVSDAGKVAILGADVSYLINTIDHNLQEGNGPPRFQRKVMYDNLPIEAIDEFRALAARQSQELIEMLDVWLARHDRDVNPSVRGTGRMRAGVGVFEFEENLAEDHGDRK